MRIAVYTVAKDDENDVADWGATTNDADLRLVVDYGSTDATCTKLRSAGIMIHQARFIPWRYDDALNSALALLPPDIDICVRLDLNERLRPNWRAAIERAWNKTTTMLLYSYNWGRINYVGDRIHRRGYRWRGRAHERLVWCGDGDAFAQFCPYLTVDYHPRNKPKPFDLALLAADAKEWPTDSEIALCFARELLFQDCYEDARNELLRFLGMVGPIGARSAYAYRLLAHADRENAMAYFNNAESAYSCPSNYLAMADYYYRMQEWRLCYTSIQFAFTLQRSSPARLPPDWGDDPRLQTSLPHELASVAAFHLWDFESAYGHAVEAVRRAPNDLRLRQHLNRVQAKIKAGATVSRQAIPFRPDIVKVPLRQDESVMEAK